MIVWQFTPYDHEFFTYKQNYYSHENSITSGNPDQVVKHYKWRSWSSGQVMQKGTKFLSFTPSPSQKLKSQKFNTVQGIINNNKQNVNVLYLDNLKLNSTLILSLCKLFRMGKDGQGHSSCIMLGFSDIYSSE